MGGDVGGDGEGEVFVGADMAGEAALGECSIFVGGAVGVWMAAGLAGWFGCCGWAEEAGILLTNLVRAVVLVVRLADFALEASLDLSSDPNAVSDLAGGHPFADLQDFADDLMADADGQWAFAPATGDGVDVGSADTASLDLDIDITVLEWLWLELRKRSIRDATRALSSRVSHLLLLEVAPLLLILDHETFEGVWVSHDGGVGSGSGSDGDV